ncbi:hypothetical protein [Mycolicibacterium sp. 050158]|uniref:hypothetical protein n=1 Tax=Mycolicibacterium sp. 050158 TaxID=3090602 RepID=UPI00299F05AE|nr:hypothetical protein [Mycolicibacterium sp. 050158]MDX1888726.1 hypothetical protein [Mycolicibacterium sp. 050158]
MGRHAATRVGAMAFALGVGAAVVGGAGPAVADDTAGAGASSSSQSAPESTSGASAVADPSTATPGSAGTATHASNVPDVPKMVIGGGTPTRHASDPPDEDVVEVPKQVDTSRDDPAPVVTPPSGQAVAAREAGPRASEHSGAATQPTTSARPGAEPVVPVVRAKTDDATATVRAAARAATVVSSTPAEQRVTESPSPATTSVSAAAATPTQVIVTRPAPNPIDVVAAVVTTFLDAVGYSLAAVASGSPITPVQFVLGVLQLVSRELDYAFAPHTLPAGVYTSAQPAPNPATSATVPDPADEAATPYGEIGKWMLLPTGQISNYGGLPSGGKQVLEAVNVIILDPVSTTPAQATQRLDTAMFWSGFAAQPVHSTGFAGIIDDVTYGQQPAIPLLGFSDNFFLVPNDHGRIFGPDPVQTSTGYVWSGAFSTETLVLNNWLPAHAYVSSEMARTALVTRLLSSGQATFVGMVPLDNAHDSATATTGDHDGYAVVLQLT